MTTKQGSGMNEWQPIATAPKGSGIEGPRDTRDPNYVSPPKLLLWNSDGTTVGYYDWYYHPGFGRGAEKCESVWRNDSGESIFNVTHWMMLPEPPRK